MTPDDDQALPAVPTDTPFALSDAEHDGVPVLNVHGEVDMATAPELRERLDHLADREVRLVVVDLTGVSFVDSTALGVLVGGVKRFRKSGGDLRLVMTDPHLAKVFTITGLDDVFAIYPTVREAAST